MKCEKCGAVVAETSAIISREFGHSTCSEAQDAVTAAKSGSGYTPPCTGGGATAPPSTNITVLDENEGPLAGDVKLNKDDHFAYIKAYVDGTIRPNTNITRAAWA